ncbi:uncharacterized protein BDW47DRAFT_108331 [Aspergillus candidus]|uniref:Uncharacterized protein n=1 Tax=Aspergillus candidus TaxID=41067 RepID=A0A2I2F7V2_ASPCN|nr:hypothetical protein BDW47DRAFT_108331 [Aspergillus candidus]PLB36702.1 hypothetical protein BDW47DRAFT_108331 [Aspergillus candidus]
MGKPNHSAPIFRYAYTIFISVFGICRVTLCDYTIHGSTGTNRLSGLWRARPRLDDVQ